MASPESLPTEAQLEQWYGPQVLSFEHAYEDSSGKHTETLYIRRTFQNFLDSSNNKRAVISVVDGNGIRLIYNSGTWKFENGSIKEVYSNSTYSNFDEYERETVAEYNSGPNKYRVIPGAGAAMIAHLVSNPNQKIPVWYSATSVNLSEGWEHSGEHLYDTTLNKWYGHLVKSTFNDSLNRFVVTPVIRAPRTTRK